MNSQQRPSLLSPYNRSFNRLSPPNPARKSHPKRGTASPPHFFFSLRGSSCNPTAMMAAASPLVSFSGTETDSPHSVHPVHSSLLSLSWKPAAPELLLSVFRPTLVVEGFWPCAGVVFRLLFLSIYLLVGSVWMYTSSSGILPAFAQVPTVLFALPISLALRQRKSITTGPKYHRSPPRKKGEDGKKGALRFSSLSPPEMSQFVMIPPPAQERKGSAAKHKLSKKPTNPARPPPDLLIRNQKPLPEWQQCSKGGGEKGGGGDEMAYG